MPHADPAVRRAYDRRRHHVVSSAIYNVRVPTCPACGAEIGPKLDCKCPQSEDWAAKDWHRRFGEGAKG